MNRKLLKTSSLETEYPQKFSENIFVSYKRNDSVKNKKQNLSFRNKMEIVIEGQGNTEKINDICAREGITTAIFGKWTQTFLNFRTQKAQEYDKSKNPIFQKNKQLICKRADTDVFNYLENYVDFSSKKSVVVLKSDSPRLDYKNDIDNVISLQKINDVRYINKYFEKVNSKLDNGGIFIGCFETLSERRNRKKINKIPILNSLYFASEFFFKRMLPKISYTQKYYFNITKGNDRILSKAEGLGRLVCCGFEIVDFKSMNGKLYFVVKKNKKPTFDLNPSYGPVYKMPRVGKDGNVIKVFKFRTMHPYSEYLQEFIVKTNGYSITGKPADDFRIPVWGKLMRKYWLDELPQLINVLKGDMKLIGVRPLSLYRFEEIPREMQKLRLPHKPGCIPPYIAYNRESDVISLLQAEKEYIEDKIKNPLTTDTKCFFKAIFNIVFLHKRSA